MLAVWRLDGSFRPPQWRFNRLLHLDSFAVRAHAGRAAPRPVRRFFSSSSTRTTDGRGRERKRALWKGIERSADPRRLTCLDLCSRRARQRPDPRAQSRPCGWGGVHATISENCLDSRRDLHRRGRGGDDRVVAACRGRPGESIAIVGCGATQELQKRASPLIADGFAALHDS